MKILYFVLCLLWFPLVNAETVTVYTSANFAPLMVNGSGGIYPDLVDYLNHQQLGALHFQLTYLPRKRLQMRLEEGSLDGIVIGMMPQWMNDVSQKKYLWTPPFAVDHFVLVSRVENPVNPNDGGLTGKSIGLTLGYVYPNIDNWILQHGLQRADALSEEINLEKLRLGRVDCVAVAESVARYYMKLHALAGKFLLIELPGRQVERRFLIPHGKEAVFDQLMPALRKLRDDPGWQQAVGKYQ